MVRLHYSDSMKPKYLECISSSGIHLIFMHRVSTPPLWKRYCEYFPAKLVILFQAEYSSFEFHHWPLYSSLVFTHIVFQESRLGIHVALEIST